VYFGSSRCSVTFKPLLLLVTVPYGKSLGPHFEKIGLQGRCDQKTLALAAGKKGT
jgi:hypothetical protein